MPWCAIEEAREADRAVISSARDAVVSPVAAAVRIAEVVLRWWAKSMLDGMRNP